MRAAKNGSPISAQRVSNASVPVVFPKNPNRRIFNRELAAAVWDILQDIHPATDTYPCSFLQRTTAILGEPMINGDGSKFGNIGKIELPRKTGRRIYATFSGSRYELTTAEILKNAPLLGADAVLVYDDRWLIETGFTRENAHLYHEGNHGFGWFAWKPYCILDALSRVDEGELVLFTDADTFPIQSLAVFYETCVREGGIMLFAACGFRQRHWCKRDCNIIMEMDEDRWRDRQAGVARFMVFQKSARSISFLEEWLHFARDIRATTSEDSTLAPEYPDCIQHRYEQAIMTNLAHRMNLPLHREADESGLQCLSLINQRNARAHR